MEVLRYLIARGLPLNIGDIAGHSALCHAVTSEILVFDIAEALLEGGADVNHRNRYGEVPLLGAFKQLYPTVVELLMKFGADVTIPEGDGITPWQCYLAFGPQIAATISKWVERRKGEEAPRAEKKCDLCGKDDMPLKCCTKCRVARYCGADCQSTSHLFPLICSFHHRSLP